MSNDEELRALRLRNAELEDVIIGLQHQIEDLVNIPAGLASSPRPVAYARVDDIRALGQSEKEMNLLVCREVMPSQALFEPLYAHPQGAELERWIRLALEWQNRLWQSEHEKFQANFKLAQIRLERMNTSKKENNQGQQH
jgi:hypothetical protein